MIQNWWGMWSIWGILRCQGSSLSNSTLLETGNSMLTRLVFLLTAKGTKIRRGLIFSRLLLHESFHSASFVNTWWELKSVGNQKKTHRSMSAEAWFPRNRKFFVRCQFMGRAPGGWKRGRPSWCFRDVTPQGGSPTPHPTNGLKRPFGPIKWQVSKMPHKSVKYAKSETLARQTSHCSCPCTASGFKCGCWLEEKLLCMNHTVPDHPSCSMSFPHLPNNVCWSWNKIVHTLYTTPQMIGFNCIKNEGIVCDKSPKAWTTTNLTLSEKQPNDTPHKIPNGFEKSSNNKSSTQLYSVCEAGESFYLCDVESHIGCARPKMSGVWSFKQDSKKSPKNQVSLFAEEMWQQLTNSYRSVWPHQSEVNAFVALSPAYPVDNPSGIGNTGWMRRRLIRQERYRK